MVLPKLYTRLSSSAYNDQSLEVHEKHFTLELSSSMMFGYFERCDNNIPIFFIDASLFVHVCMRKGDLVMTLDTGGFIGCGSQTSCLGLLSRCFHAL